MARRMRRALAKPITHAQNLGVTIACPRNGRNLGKLI
jgi:hypothetical protein